MTFGRPVAKKGALREPEANSKEKRKVFCQASVRPRAVGKENFIFSISGGKATNKEESVLETFSFSEAEFQIGNEQQTKKKVYFEQEVPFALGGGPRIKQHVRIHAGNLLNVAYTRFLWGTARVQIGASVTW